MSPSLARPAAVIITVTILALAALIPRVVNAEGSTAGSAIVSIGVAQAGGDGGQCKVFVKDIVRAAIGISIGAGYRQAFLDVGVEIDPADARPGDILQVSNPSSHERYELGYHTAIVVENLGNGRFLVVDSNWGWDERVRVHEWTPRPTSHLRLHAYRVGQSIMDRIALVATGRSCLNLRTGPGLDHARIECLDKGTELTILGDATIADGYTWVRVESQGQQGWVAAEYLAIAAAGTVWELGDQASVETNGSCLYLRTGAGMENGVNDCIPDGELVTIVAIGAIAADGYTWLEVETSTGVRGWMAAEYLVAR